MRVLHFYFWGTRNGDGESEWGTGNGGSKWGQGMENVVGLLGELTGNGVPMGNGGTRREWGWGQISLPSGERGRGRGKRGGSKDGDERYVPRPRPAPLPSLQRTYYGFFLGLLEYNKRRHL